MLHNILVLLRLSNRLYILLLLLLLLNWVISLIKLRILDNVLWLLRHAIHLLWDIEHLFLASLGLLRDVNILIILLGWREWERLIIEVKVDFLDTVIWFEVCFLLVVMGHFIID